MKNRQSTLFYAHDAFIMHGKLYDRMRTMSLKLMSGAENSTRRWTYQRIKPGELNMAPRPVYRLTW